MTKKEAKAAEVLANKRLAYVRKVNSLLGHVSGRVRSGTILQDGFEADRTADEYAAIIASREPVGKALHPAKADAVNYAETTAKGTVERVRRELAKHGMDRNAYAPYPRGSSWDANYMIARARYQLVHALTSSDAYTGRMGAPDICHMDTDMVERFVDNARRDAALQYDAFICKMVAKVGEAIDAELEGTHVWSHSLLTVTKEDGSREVWKTQQIVNQTKYGSPYLQWPSRKLK